MLVSIFSFKTTFRFLILLQILEKTIKNIILYAQSIENSYIIL